MTADEFQKICLRTEKPAKLVLEVDRARLLHAAIGLGTEAGELLDNVKRVLFYGKSADDVNVLEECGDALWYISLALTACGYTMSQAMELNMLKLKARYPDGWTQDAALVRDLGLERAVLEGK